MSDANRITAAVAGTAFGILIVTALYASGMFGFHDVDAQLEAVAAEPVAAAETAALDVSVPAVACAEIVSQDYDPHLEYVRFEVLCRDAAGTYTGFRDTLKRENLRAHITRFDYHFTDQDEMTIAER